MHPGGQLHWALSQAGTVRNHIFDKAAVIDSLGLASWPYHAEDEYIEVDSIAPRLYGMPRMLMKQGDP